MNTWNTARRGSEALLIAAQHFASQERRVPIGCGWIYWNAFMVPRSTFLSP